MTCWGLPCVPLGSLLSAISPWERLGSCFSRSFFLTGVSHQKPFPIIWPPCPGSTCVAAVTSAAHTPGRARHWSCPKTLAAGRRAMPPSSSSIPALPSASPKPLLSSPDLRGAPVTEQLLAPRCSCTCWRCSPHPGRLNDITLMCHDACLGQRWLKA